MLATQSKSIEIGTYKDFRAINMTWKKHIDRKDVKFAFDELTTILDNQEEPICVIIDLQENSFMPLTDTFKAALRGPHSHPNLAIWLVIGENVFARSIADMLNRFGDNQKIQWFDSNADIDAFLEDVCPHI